MIHPTIITLSGEPGAGKTTTLAYLQKFYNTKGINVQTYRAGDAYKRIADKLGISVEELNKLAKTDPKYDKMIDSTTQLMADEIMNNPTENTVYIFDSRMAWHFIPNALSVRLILSSEEAGKRMFYDPNRPASDKHDSVEEAIEKQKTRKKDEIERFKNLFGVDISDPKNYQLIVDTHNAKPEEIAKLISVCANLQKSNKFFPKMWEGLGGNIMPSKNQSNKKVELNEEQR